jgi:hypothetical protein
MPQPSTAASSPVPAGFPPLSGPARIFAFDRELEYHVTAYTTQSRFVLYDDGRFALQYRGGGSGYAGKYADNAGTVSFEWEAYSLPGPWGATGTLTGDSLSVRYNTIMSLDDFEDAVYRLQP